MQRLATYSSKKVQFEQEVDQSNIAAQRAYTRTQIQLNNARSLALLENQEDFKKMLANEGMIEAKAAERGVRGKSVARQLVMNSANFGMSQRMRSRGLAMAGYQAKEVREDVNRQLKTALNRSFAGVAIQPVADLAPPPPVMQNVGLTLMLGMGEALAAGIGGMSNTGDGLNASASQSQASTISAGKSMGYGANTYYTGIPSGNALPSGSFGISSIAPRGSMINYFTN
tara:strand:+ start:3320 stop:4003 length:684 start_codon:yes stop_codon:yes gene_type:complete